MSAQEGKGAAADANANANDNFRVSAPQISLPKGGGAIRGIGEKFAANPVTGTGSLTVPIYASPGRSAFGPQLSLSYDSGAGNGPFGFGWNLALPSITRKTDKGLPRYDDDGMPDTFILSGVEDLVPALVEINGAWIRIEDRRTLHGLDYRIHRYRPRIEGLFARIERWSNETDPKDVFWRSISKDNIVTWYGASDESRIADPDDPSRIFTWLICKSHDDKGNLAVYRYVKENSDGVAVARANERNRTARSRSANRYLKRIQYGNRTAYYPDLDAVAPTPEPADWCFELVFDYGDHDQAVPLPDESGKTWICREDPFSSFRATFEVRTYRLCRRALMFHHFPGQPDVGADCMVRSTDFTFSQDVTPSDPRNSIYAFLVAVAQTGYKRASAGYLAKSLPALEFEYTEPIIDESIHEVDRANLENLPHGLDGARYQWVDLDSEGISGILTEQAGSWFYKRNLSPIGSPDEPGGMPSAARFAPAELVRRKPSLGTLGGGQQLLDLAGDGQLDLVQFDAPTPGFFERTDDGDWSPLQPFASLPVLDWNNPNLKFIDLTGDGHADILISEDEVLCWHASLAEVGFGPRQRVRQALDEEKGPKVVFADSTESISLADMSGDGLTDIVRIRNGEVCYWPNLGYGRFGAKVTMDGAPWFEAGDLFDGRRVRLADIDGSGTTDIIYFASRGTHLYFNQSGNGWSLPRPLLQFPPVDQTSSAMAVDLLGNGTACLVWSSSLPGRANRSLRYVDLMGGAKPHLLVKIVNNLGAETRIQYAPSTRFYLEDKLAQKPWITRLPFPVHVVARVETYDHVSRNRFVTRHAYHHGYFDGVEREFRGFGMVEQWDTEEFAALTDSGDFPAAINIDAASHVPPVLTRTWFHTGVYLGRGRVSGFFAGLLNANDKGEYYREPSLSDQQAKDLLLDDTVLPDGWSVEEEREACRALKGSMLRQEIYALDGSAKEPHPYSVTEQNFTVQRLQPQAGNPFSVFIAHARETLNYHYERNPKDPRIEHALTLEVDAFGNVLRSLAVGYGRRVADANLGAPDQQKQSAVLITYTKSDHTNAVDLPDVYRTPLPCDVKTYELTGFVPVVPVGRFGFAEWTANNFSRLGLTPEIAYETTADPLQQQKRLIERVCTRYRRNDLAAVLPQGAMESSAIPAEAYKLAFTPGLLAGVYRRTISSAPPEDLLPNPAQVLFGPGGDRGGYVDLFGDGHWWAPSGRTFFDANADIANPATTAPQELAQARGHFFQPEKFADPFGNATTLQYDADDLFPIREIDPLGNTTNIALDYRVLQPRRVTDANGNRSEAAFDVLGLVAGTAVQGKATETLGDRLTGFDPDPTQAQIDAFFLAADPHTLAPSLLADATTRIVYDQDRFRRTRAANPADPTQWQPAYVATLARETHAGDLPAGQQSRIHIGFDYSDGFGREIQKKIQAEPGPLTPSGPVATPRWIGSGWTIFNNKGKPVRQYEPYFSAAHGFEFARTVGVSPILFYDPLGRVVATLHPDHSWEKVIFDPWRQETWDASDTVLIADPKSDPDVADFFHRLPDADYLPGWYAQRQGGARGPEAKAAADKTAIHAGTPTVVHSDSLGRAFLTIAHNKYKTGDMAPAAPPIEEFHATRVLLDIEGNQRAVIDALDRVVMRYDYDMLGHRIHQASMEAGERWTLNDVTGKPIRIWDSRGHEFRSVCDPLRRPIESWMRQGAGTELMVARTVYGEGQATPEAGNLRGRTFQVSDQAGVVTTDEYDFKGNLLRGQRQLAVDYKTTLDWSPTAAAVPLEPAVYTTRTRYDALNRPIELTSPDNSVVHPGYNEANLLERLDVNLRGAAAATAFVTNIDYDAKGQRVLIAYGNTATTEYAYDPETFRLAHLTTTRPGFAPDESVVQDLSYTYDPVGNITHIRDDAQQTIYFRNKRVEPSAEYTYDAVHRLIEAFGREHLGQSGNTPNAPAAPDAFDTLHTGLLHPGDGNAMGTYVERYLYDFVGNILAMQHRGSDPVNSGWTRNYAYNEASLIEPGKSSNRLSSTTVGASATATYGHDAHGNITTMPHLPLMQWDFHDQLQATARQAVSAGTPETTWYVYDASGQRVRKVTERQAAAGDTPTRMKERIYLPGFEVYREYASDGRTVDLERETLHVMDDRQRIALVETRTQGTDGASAQLVRYQFGNHLGSASLELDDQAQIVSYEEYFPYGSTSYQAVSSQTETPKRYRYTGKERDEETGLSYHGARYYALWLGRWVSTDPLSLIDGLNVYFYTGNNPVRFNDPTGNQSHNNFSRAHYYGSGVPSKSKYQTNKATNGSAKGDPHLSSAKKSAVGKSATPSVAADSGSLQPGLPQTNRPSPPTERASDTKKTKAPTDVADSSATLHSQGSSAGQKSKSGMGASNPAGSKGTAGTGSSGSPSTQQSSGGSSGKSSQQTYISVPIKPIPSVSTSVQAKPVVTPLSPEQQARREEAKSQRELEQRLSNPDIIEDYKVVMWRNSDNPFIQKHAETMENIERYEKSGGQSKLIKASMWFGFGMDAAGEFGDLTGAHKASDVDFHTRPDMIFSPNSVNVGNPPYGFPYMPPKK